MTRDLIRLIVQLAVGQQSVVERHSVRFRIRSHSLLKQMVDTPRVIALSVGKYWW
jgi:hypothetical protein